MKFKDIVNEIAWRCKDGMPNFKRADDVKLLKNQLIKEGWSLKAIYSLLDNLNLTEEEKADVIADTLAKARKKAKKGQTYSSPRSKRVYTRGEEGEEGEEGDYRKDLSVDKHDDLKKEHWSPKFKKEYNNIQKNLKKSKDSLETEEAKKRIEGYKNTSRDITESTGIPLHLGSSASEEEKFNLADAIFSKREVQQKYYYDVIDRPKGSRAKSIKKLAEDLKAKGYTINKVTSKHLTAWTPEGKYITVHSKPTIVGKSKRGESTAYEGVVALAYALGESEYTEEEIPEILESLMKEGTVTTKNGMVVNIADLRADALKYFTNPENLESMANKLKDILSNKNVAVEIAVAKDLLEKGNFPEGTKIKVDCEGGTDDDKFRADIVIYAETPDGERTALLASSVKDGKNVQLAQLGPRRAVDAINDTEPGSDERREMILHHPTDKSAYIHQIQKLPESMQGAYMERIMQAENPDELHIELMNGVLDAADDDPRAIYDFMMFSIVGHDPPEGVGSFLYQNAGKVSRVPLTGSKEAEKMVAKITELYKSGRIRKSEDPEKGDFLMYIDDDGNEIPLLKTRSKYTNDGNLERVLVEKGGRNSALLKLLSGELG